MLKSISVFIGVYVLGFLITMITAMTIGSSDPYDLSYYNMIIFSILYLSGVVAVCTSLVIKAIKEK